MATNGDNISDYKEDQSSALKSLGQMGKMSRKKGLITPPPSPSFLKTATPKKLTTGRKRI
jgi:hypothetical protein